MRTNWGKQKGQRKIRELPEKLKGLCTDCYHRDSCGRPCRPVEMILLKTTERRKIWREEKKDSVVLKDSRNEIREASLLRSSDSGENRNQNPLAMFSTEADSPWRQFEPQLVQTGIFIDRFFLKMSLSDLAIKYDRSPHAVSNIFSKAVLRIFVVLQELDKRRMISTIVDGAKQAEKMPQEQKWFLMNTIFNMTIRQIFEYERRRFPLGTIQSALYKFGERLAAGESDIILFAPAFRKKFRPPSPKSVGKIIKK